MQKNNNETSLLFIVVAIVGFATYQDFTVGLSFLDKVIFSIFVLSWVIILGLFYYKHFSKRARDEKQKMMLFKEVPACLKEPSLESVRMGLDIDHNRELYLPDHIRKRHVHILGVTGSGKTESVILNFLKQDINRGLGAIILDAKGDQSFIDYLTKHADSSKVKVFDLSDEKSVGYDPLFEGSPLESAQRLFSSMTWSEEYYKSKAYSALQTTFNYHFQQTNKNPTIMDLKRYFTTHTLLAEILGISNQSKAFETEYNDLSGLRDQILGLSIGHLEKILSPASESEKLSLYEVFDGKILYFRLQSLLSPQAVQVIGKLIIQNINFLTGEAHRKTVNGPKITPIYIDEFATFASPEFADLISKARSAGFALHFSHQSNGELIEVSQGFLSRITDNSATQIILRVNDPDTAEFYSRAFGTRMYNKVTQRVTNTLAHDAGENTGEGSMREAHQFRSSPDHFKTLPTGTGSVLIAHGHKTKFGASHVFTVQFPRLT